MQAIISYQKPEAAVTGLLRFLIQKLLMITKWCFCFCNLWTLGAEMQHSVVLVPFYYLFGHLHRFNALQNS